MPVAQMGSNLIIDLSSSTWVTVQSLQESTDPFIASMCVSTAALSKKLRKEKTLVDGATAMKNHV